MKVLKTNFRVVFTFLFFCDLNMYYVGIASGDIEDRLSKHIVKVFGSYVGRGVNHTSENI